MLKYFGMILPRLRHSSAIQVKGFSMYYYLIRYKGEAKRTILFKPGVRLISTSYCNTLPQFRNPYPLPNHLHTKN